MPCRQRGSWRLCRERTCNPSLSLGIVGVERGSDDGATSGRLVERTDRWRRGIQPVGEAGVSPDHRRAGAAARRRRRRPDRPLSSAVRFQAAVSVDQRARHVAVVCSQADARMVAAHPSRCVRGAGRPRGAACGAVARPATRAHRAQGSRDIRRHSSTSSGWSCGSTWSSTERR